jgi:hypothetical protein
MLQDQMEQRQFKQFRTCLIAMDMKERAMKGAMNRLEERLWKAVVLQNPLQTATITTNADNTALSLPPPQQQQQQQQQQVASSFNMYGVDSALVPAVAAAAEAAASNMNTLLNNLRSSYVHMHTRFLEMEERVNRLSQQQASMPMATKKSPVGSSSVFSDSRNGKENSRDTSDVGPVDSRTTRSIKDKNSHDQEPTDSFDIDWPSGKEKPKSTATGGSKKEPAPLTSSDASSYSSSIKTSSTAGTVNASTRRRASNSRHHRHYDASRHYGGLPDHSHSNSSFDERYDTKHLLPVAHYRSPPSSSATQTRRRVGGNGHGHHVSRGRLLNATQDTSLSSSNSLDASYDKHYFASSNDSGSNSSSFYEDEKEETMSLLCHDAEAGENDHAYASSDIFVLRGARNRLGCILSANSILSNSAQTSNQDQHHGCGQATIGGNNGVKRHDSSHNHNNSSSNHPCARPWFKNRSEKTAQQRRTVKQEERSSLLESDTMSI